MWDLELPLALIMEEILEWEKKPGQDEDKDRPDSTGSKNSDK